MDIAAYSRVSTNHAEQLDSLENQKEFFVEYARRNGHRLVHLYADEGISGTSLRRRDQFLRLMQDAKLGLFQCVVVKDVSRFARNTVDFLQSIRELKAMGVNVMFITANMESLGESEFILTIFGAMAQEESANLSKRIKFGKRINAKKGRAPYRIFGYDRIDNYTMAINPVEAQVVRDIYRMYLEDGTGYRSIAAVLNSQKRYTKYDNEWGTTAIKRILTNPIYCGRYINHKVETESFLTGKRVKIPEEEVFRHDRPEWAIISLETFESAQRQLEERKRKHAGDLPPTRYSSRYGFSSLIKCEHCGYSFCHKSYTYVNTRVFWKCSTNDQYGAKGCDNRVKLDEKELMRVIREYLSSLIEDKAKFADEVLDNVRDKIPKDESQVDLSRMERRKAELQGKKRKYMEMYANDVLTMSELKSQTEKLSDELAALEHEMKRLLRAQEIRNDAEHYLEQYKKEIQRFLAFETVTNADMRKIVDHISANRDGNIRIFLRKIKEFGTKQ